MSEGGRFASSSQNRRYSLTFIEFVLEEYWRNMARPKDKRWSNGKLSEHFRVPYSTMYKWIWMDRMRRGMPKDPAGRGRPPLMNDAQFKALLAKAREKQRRNPGLSLVAALRPMTTSRNTARWLAERANRQFIRS